MDGCPATNYTDEPQDRRPTDVRQHIGDVIRCVVVLAGGKTVVAT